MRRGRRGTWQHAVCAALSAAMVVLAVVPVGVDPASAAATRPEKGASTTTPTTTRLPPLPAVSLSVTAGQSVPALLSRAVALDSVGVDTSGVRSAIAITQQQLDQDAVTLRQLRQTAAQAEQRATTLLAQARHAAQGYASLDNAVKQAVLFMYINGTSTLTVNPNAGAALAFAIPYADTAITPNGVLATRSYDAKLENEALAGARKAQAVATRATAAASADMAAEQSAKTRLILELSSILSGPANRNPGATASEIAAEQAAVAAQAGVELRSAASLQFTPKGAIPPPLPTAGTALAWAFAELGKPYAWGATGPNSFDCSGLTQFVWRQAGVAIPRVAAGQYSWTIPVPLSQLLPGDLVFYGTTDIHHVGIYIGDGLMINAPHTGTVVQVSSIWWSDLAGFGRVHDPGVPVPLHSPPNLTHPAPPEVVATPGPVPSQKKPPPGWKPKPGSTTPLAVHPGPHTRPAPTTTVPRPVPSTSVAPPTTAASSTAPPTTEPATTSPPTSRPAPATSSTTTSTTTSTSTTTTSTLPGG